MEIEELVRKKYGELFPEQKFVPGETYIPVAKAVFGEQEVSVLVQAALEMKIVDGKITHEFELDLAKFMGTRYATTCNSGSSANLLAFMALTSPMLGSKAIRPGDEVITCAVGFPTTAAPIAQFGAIPVWVDVSLLTYNPTPRMISEAITEKTKAIFLAHTLGNPLEIQAIKDIAEQSGLWLIEDCCDGIGGEYDGQKIGTFGDIATTSFYPAHLMMVGEGGAVFTNSSMLNKIIRSMRDWGRECWCSPNKDNTCGKRFTQKNKGELPDGFDHKYIYSHLGYNLKSTDLQSSIGREQVKRLPGFISQRRHNWQVTREAFQFRGLDGYLTLPTATRNSDPAWFGFLLTVKADAPFTRDELTRHLESKKIGTRNLFGGNLTRQPAFLGIGIIADQLPKADVVMNSTFWIGIHPAITEEMTEYIADTIEDFINEKTQD